MARWGLFPSYSMTNKAECWPIIWYPLTETPNKRPKKTGLQRMTSGRKTKTSQWDNKHFRSGQINNLLHSLRKKKERSDALVSWAMTKRPERQLKWIMTKVFPWLRKTVSQHLIKSRTLSKRQEYHYQTLQSGDACKYREFTPRCKLLFALEIGGKKKVFAHETRINL